MSDPASVDGTEPLGESAPGDDAAPLEVAAPVGERAPGEPADSRTDAAPAEESAPVDADEAPRIDTVPVIGPASVDDAAEAVDVVTDEVPPAFEPTPIDLPPATVQIARTALLDVTPASTVGVEWRGVLVAENAVSVLFPCTMAGYPGWNWTVTLSVLGGDEPPSVLEMELLPGEGALLAPEWVPWSDRLAEYNTAQELAEEEAARAAEAEADDDGDGEDDEDEDEETLEETDLTDDLDDVLDGVEFEETDDEDSDEDDSDEDDSDEDDDDDDEDDEDSDDEDSDDDEDSEDDDYDAPRTDEDDEGNVY